MQQCMIVYIVKEFASLRGLGELISVAHKRTRTRATGKIVTLQLAAEKQYKDDARIFNK